jgi:hypothetical protein
MSDHDNDLLKKSLDLYERLEESNCDRMTYLRSRNSFLLDASRGWVAKMYRQNWDGCRELWKQDYRRRKERI